jgi:t-SNARE complex subunit (syntaxin)
MAKYVKKETYENPNWRNLPRVPEGKIRDKHIKVVVNKDEMELIEKLTLEAKLNSVSKYVREQALSGKELTSGGIYGKYPLKKIGSLNFEVRKIGVNVNQMTRKLHQRGAFDQNDRKALKKIRESFDAFREEATKLHNELINIKLEKEVKSTEVQEEVKKEEFPYFEQPGFNIVNHILNIGKK